MPDNQNQPLEEDTPRGLLFILDPAYADLIPAEEKFVLRMDKARLEGRLYFSNPDTKH